MENSVANDKANGERRMTRRMANGEANIMNIE